MDPETQVDKLHEIAEKLGRKLTEAEAESALLALECGLECSTFACYLLGLEAAKYTNLTAAEREEIR